jgi:uncharacterized protein YijF (DUF1287 family)
MMRKNLLLLSLGIFLFTFSCRDASQTAAQTPNKFNTPATAESPKTSEIQSDEIKKVLVSLLEQTNITKGYDPAYIVLAYPMGDVKPETGVCTDVVVRSFRKAGVDLQKEVHEDMLGNFSAYPKKWGLPAPDANIDHRRVPNLQTFFTRKGKSLQVTKNAEEYKPGDVVSWDLDGRGMTHIGVVSDIWNADTKRYSIIHNIGAGTKAEDVVFDWKITGHYRYF